MSDPDKILKLAQRSAFQLPAAIDDADTKCEGMLCVQAYYYDRWRTPVVGVPLKITDSSNTVIEDGTVTTLALANFGLEDGLDIESCRAELGTHTQPIAHGTVTVELAGDPSVDAQIQQSEQAIYQQLDSFKNQIIEKLNPWITTWQVDGWTSVPAQYTDGVITGLEEWWNSESEFWITVGDYIGKAGDWYLNDGGWWKSTLPGMAYLYADWLVDQFGSTEKLWEFASEILGALKALAQGSIDLFEAALEKLADLPGEIGEICKLLVRHSAEWAMTLIEIVRETNVIEKLFLTFVGAVMVAPPNFWAEVVGTVQGFLLPEVIITILFIVIAALTEGAAAPLLVARIATFVKKVKTALKSLNKVGAVLVWLLDKVDEIAKLLVKLFKLLKKKISEYVKDISEKIIKIKRKVALKIKIKKALVSSDPDIRLEGQVAQKVGKRTERFQEEVIVDGRRIGEIDIETDKAIIEVTSGEGNHKVKQMRKLINNSDINPTGKKVVLYSPNITSGRAKAIENIGGRVIRSLDELEVYLGAM